mmetsp:Transcript_147064/g.366831  ORF Transcript_147064/g.366831 Transcript_147064/m.366831 type:complete len:205 (+) Transcript_147064:387-1001(+)
MRRMHFVKLRLHVFVLMAALIVPAHCTLSLIFLDLHCKHRASQPHHVTKLTPGTKRIAQHRLRPAIFAAPAAADRSPAHPLWLVEQLSRGKALIIDLTKRCHAREQRQNRLQQTVLLSAVAPLCVGIPAIEGNRSRNPRGTHSRRPLAAAAKATKAVHTQPTYLAQPQGEQHSSDHGRKAGHAYETATARRATLWNERSMAHAT